MGKYMQLLSFDRYRYFGGETEFFPILDEIFQEHLPIPFLPPPSPLGRPPSPFLHSFSPPPSPFLAPPLSPTAFLYLPPSPPVVSSLPSPHTPTVPSLPPSLLPGTPPAAPASAPVSNPNKRKREHQQKDHPYVKKPPNAFMIFLQDQRPKVVAELHLTDSTAVNAVMGQRWREMSPEQRNVYFDQAHKEQRLHEQQQPGWVPNYNRPSCFTPGPLIKPQPNPVSTATPACISSASSTSSAPDSSAHHTHLLPLLLKNQPSNHSVPDY
ncbi:lymphoid enhancer-binding factor 1 [Nothobranchius furzeri]|uniref:Transcript variant X1 n=1 Tax=Nothobranchius furzeri TaxID=105023 RepID=A0A9D2Y2F8_NOTFU|nr:transcript variant X1 [Nothobranchius furzeri]KAF7212802.1 transcript variant X2 [Nothobranchius furzeri]